MEICVQPGEAIPFLAKHLVLINFFDERPNTANRIFSLKVAEMLESHVRGTQSTCLYIIPSHFFLVKWLSDDDDDDDDDDDPNHHHHHH